MSSPKGRAWHAERAKRKGGSNVRGNKREKHEMSRVKGHYRNGHWVNPFYRHKGKRG